MGHYIKAVKGFIYMLMYKNNLSEMVWSNKSRTERTGSLSVQEGHSSEEHEQRTGERDRLYQGFIYLLGNK